MGEPASSTDQAGRTLNPYCLEVPFHVAALPETLWDRMRPPVAEHADHPVPLTASCGTTEMAPAASARFASARRASGSATQERSADANAG